MGSVVNPPTVETNKLPLFYHQKEKDTLEPKTWLDHCEQAAIVLGWSDQQKILAASFALRGLAKKWYRVEIEPLSNPTWGAFREKLLEFTLHGNLPYRGAQVWQKILAPSKESNVTGQYLELASYVKDFYETLPEYVHSDTFMPQQTLAMPGIQNMTAAEKQAFADATVAQIRNIDMNKLGIGVFFSGLPLHVRDFLLARDEYQDLVHLKNAVESFLSSKQSQWSVNEAEATKGEHATSRKAKQPKKRISYHRHQRKDHGQKECCKWARYGVSLVKLLHKNSEAIETSQAQHVKVSNQSTSHVT